MTNTGTGAKVLPTSGYRCSTKLSFYFSRLKLRLNKILVVTLRRYEIMKASTTAIEIYEGL